MLIKIKYFYLMREQTIKACLAAGKYKEDILFLPFCSSLINNSLSTFTNIWLNVKITTVLLITHTFNSLLQKKKWRQIGTSQPKLCSKFGAEVGLKVKKTLSLYYSDTQKAILFGYNLSLVISCRYSENSAHLIPFFFFFLLPRIIIKEIKLSGTVVFLDL